MGSVRLIYIYIYIELLLLLLLLILLLLFIDSLIDSLIARSIHLLVHWLIHSLVIWFIGHYRFIDCFSQLQKVKSGMGSPDWHVFDESCACTVLDMLESKEMTEQTDWRDWKTPIAGGLRLGLSEVLRSLRHYLRAQSQGHHTVDRLEERGVERGSAYSDLPWEDEKGISSIRPTLELFQKQHWGNSWEKGWSA